MLRRRDFVKSMSCAPIAFGAGSMASMLAMAPAQAADVSGYRALVCVFLFGGMDGHDTILPYDPASYETYANIRSSLLSSYNSVAGGSSRDLGSLLELNPSTADFGSRRFALPPQLSGIDGLFRRGKAAVVANVGPLAVPTNREQFLGRAVVLPSRLFSHNDQQSTWMSFQPEGAQFGWGGLFGDAAVRAGANNDAIFSQISAAGNTVYLSGNLVRPYQVSDQGVPTIGLIEAAGQRIDPATQALMRNHFTSAGSTRSNLFERDLVNLSRESLGANDLLSSALRSSAEVRTNFPASTLGAQLRSVAQTIAVRQALGIKRQVFFVGLGGFDTHSGQATDLPALQQDLGDSIAAFYTATQELAVENEVTTFTASDFGRTLTVNGDGTDHGWGSHHFVVGGAVRGGDIYGDIPVSALGHKQDAGNGRLIPTLPVEQFAHPLGRWFGLNEPELNAALPGLVAFHEERLSYI